MGAVVSEPLDRAIATAEESLSQPCVLAKHTPALQQLATEKSLALIFDQDAGLLAWAHPSLDLRAEIVAKLDQAQPK